MLLRRMSSKSEVMQIACPLGDFYEAPPMTALFDERKSGDRRRNVHYMYSVLQHSWLVGWYDLGLTTNILFRRGQNIFLNKGPKTLLSCVKSNWTALYIVEKARSKYR